MTFAFSFWIHLQSLKLLTHVFSSKLIALWPKGLKLHEKSRKLTAKGLFSRSEGCFIIRFSHSSYSCGSIFLFVFILSHFRMFRCSTCILLFLLLTKHTNYCIDFRYQTKKRNRDHQRCRGSYNFPSGSFRNDITCSANISRRWWIRDCLFLHWESGRKRSHFRYFFARFSPGKWEKG